MATCDVCGNEYDKRVTIAHQERTRTFDSFEYAISAMAPVCANCGVTIIARGLENAERIYCCCALCAAGGHKQPIR